MVLDFIKVQESLEPFMRIIPEVNEMVAFSAVGVMFDHICEVKGLDKNKALQMMNDVITETNNEAGNMYEIAKIVKRKTLQNVLDNYLSKDLRNQIISDLEEAALIDEFAEKD